MKTANLRFAIALIAVTSFAVDVHYNFDKDADFSKYKTYKWVEIKGGLQLDDLGKRQITEAIQAELGKKGLAKVETDPSDLLIGFQAATSQEKQITSYNDGWGYGPGWGAGRWGMAPGISTATTSTLLVGTLAVDMYDAQKQQLVWRGAATKTLDPEKKPEKRQKELTKALDKLFKNYPPKEKK